MFGFFKKKSAKQANAEPALDRSRIVPRIKHVNFVDSMQGLMTEAEKLGALAPEQMPVTKPLVGDLLVAYAFDSPHSFMFINHETMEAVGLCPESLHQLSMSNLDRALPDFRIQEKTFYKIVRTGNHLEPCTLLFPGIWQKRAAQAKGNLLMVVPTRNAVFYLDSGEPIQLEGNTLTLEQLEGIMCTAAGIEKVYEGVKGPHCLSDHIFVWEDGWRVYGDLKNARWIPNP